MANPFKKHPKKSWAAVAVLGTAAAVIAAPYAMAAVATSTVAYYTAAAVVTAVALFSVVKLASLIKSWFSPSSKTAKKEGLILGDRSADPQQEESFDASKISMPTKTLGGRTPEAPSTMAKISADAAATRHSKDNASVLAAAEDDHTSTHEEQAADFNPSSTSL